MTKIKDLTPEEIEEYLGFFDKDKRPFERYASFDYCFNYFQGFKDKAEITKDMRRSCLELGFYLASWGMYRGAGFLLQKSVRIFEPVMVYIVSPECDVWGIDVDNYTKDGNINKLIKCAGKIEEILKVHKPTRTDWDTLVTKIMLGVFGNVPAFDTYFKIGSGLKTFDEHSLGKIKNFYDDHKNKITQKLKTFDDKSPNEEEANYRYTDRHYTNAKIIDMIFFTKGFLEDTCWGNYTGENPKTRGNAIESARKAGYEKLRAQNITKEEWFKERKKKLEKKKGKVNRPNANNSVAFDSSGT